MDKGRNFEDKIRTILESHDPGRDEMAWEEFQPMLEDTTVPFWKRWFVPYLYSTLLFVLTLTALWWMVNRGNMDVIEGQVPSENVIITRSDTVFVYDTVYVIKEVFVQESVVGKLRFERNDMSSADAFVQPEKTSNEAFLSAGFAEQDKAGEEVIPLVRGPETKAEEGGGTEELRAQTTDSRKNHYPAPQAIDPYAKDEIPDFIKRREDETVVGDTSTLASTPMRRGVRKSLYVQPEAHFIFPTSRNIEFDGGVFPGVQLGLFWNDRVGIAAGAMRGVLRGEIDDPEDMDAGLLRTFPSSDNLPEDPDDIDIRSSQWFFPLTLQLNSHPVNQVLFEGSLGVVGNYITKQRISYVFEDESRIPTLHHTVRNRAFNLSHLAMGLGTRYALSERFYFHLNTSYWLPLVRTGIEQNKAHLFGVKLGVSYKLLGVGRELH